MRATNCCCGIPLHTAVVIYGSFDVIIGIMYTIAFLAGVSQVCLYEYICTFNHQLSYAPDFGMYELSWLVSSFAEGFLAIVGGCIGVVAVQKKSASLASSYSYIKALQYICMVIACLMILLNIQDIADQLTDETIARMIEDAERKHMDPPKIDRESMLMSVSVYLDVSCKISLVQWTTLGLYGFYIIHSLGRWYREGRDPSERRITISIDPQSEGRQVHNISPLLQGQTPTIPVAIQ